MQIFQFWLSFLSLSFSLTSFVSFSLYQLFTLVFPSVFPSIFSSFWSNLSFHFLIFPSFLFLVFLLFHIFLSSPPLPISSSFSFSPFLFLSLSLHPLFQSLTLTLFLYSTSSYRCISFSHSLFLLLPIFLFNSLYSLVPFLSLPLTFSLYSLFPSFFLYSLFPSLFFLSAPSSYLFLSFSVFSLSSLSWALKGGVERWEMNDDYSIYI